MDSSRERVGKSTLTPISKAASRTLQNSLYNADLEQEGNQQQVISMLSGLQSSFSSLLQVVSTRLKYDQVKEEAFDVLYQEMEDLKENQELSQLRPLYIDLILLIDRMNSIYNAKLDSGCKSLELVDTLQTLSHEVLEILYRRGVELIVSTSTHFNPKLQKVVEVVGTSNSEEENEVVEVVRHGFKYKDVILRPEEVKVKKYKKKAEVK